MWLLRIWVLLAVACGWLPCGTGLAAVAEGETSAATPSPKPGLVYILPIRDDIMPPLVYLVRRGVKEAMEAGADLLVLDMRTDGGRVDVTEEIIGIVNRFPGKSVTYVNDRAFSAGAFIAMATQKIYMAPQSVIGAATPIAMSPLGSGGEAMPASVEAKMTSAIRALVRVQAEKNGHNVEVAEAMIDRTKELRMDGQVLNPTGSILTLTDQEAARLYGTPPKPLLSSGTVASLDALLVQLGHAEARQVRVEPTGAEKVGTWINAIGPLLLMIGMVGLYIEFKTPGFGLPGIVGIIAFALYFLGGYVAGLTAAGWVLVFVLGLVLLALEWFVFPGTLVAGLSGALLIVVALVMSMVDLYPGGPVLPSLPQVQAPLRDLSLAAFGALAAALLLARWLPRTTLFGGLVSLSASGVESGARQESGLDLRRGQAGVAVSPLRPGGKARFGEDLLDVITQGEWVEAGRPVRIVGRAGWDAVVEEIGERGGAGGETGV